MQEAAPANMRNKLKCWFVLPDIFAIQIECINSHKLNSQNSTLSLFLDCAILFMCDAMLMKMLKYLACRLLHSTHYGTHSLHNEQKNWNWLLAIAIFDECFVFAWRWADIFVALSTSFIRIIKGLNQLNFVFDSIYHVFVCVSLTLCK